MINSARRIAAHGRSRITGDEVNPRRTMHQGHMTPDLRQPGQAEVPPRKRATRPWLAMSAGGGRSMKRRGFDSGRCRPNWPRSPLIRSRTDRRSPWACSRRKRPFFPVSVRYSPSSTAQPGATGKGRRPVILEAPAYIYPITRKAILPRQTA